MCLILFAYRLHPDYPLIVAANRDEFYHRQTLPAHWWNEAPQLLAGKDLVAGGTWLGVTANGRFSAITNVREPHIASPAPSSRGLLPRRYLAELIDSDRFASLLQQTKDHYRGYNILYGSPEQLVYYSNRFDKSQLLKPGLYGLSNAQLNSPWPKVVTGKRLLQELIATGQLSTEALLTLLSSTAIFPDQQLPATGVSLEWERRLSALFITGPGYGTRSSTALLINRNGQVDFQERSMVGERQEVSLTFTLQK